MTGGIETTGASRGLGRDLVQMNVEDTRLGVAEYVSSRTAWRQ